MKFIFTIIIGCLVWICDCRHLTGCRDMYVWVADGSVDCKYLYTPSFYGLHSRPEYFCRSYPLTYCCDTCTNKVLAKITMKSTVPSTENVASTKTSTSTSTETNNGSMKSVPKTIVVTTSGTTTTTTVQTTEPAPRLRATTKMPSTTTVRYVPVAPARFDVFDVIIQALDKPASP